MTESMFWSWVLKVNEYRDMIGKPCGAMEHRDAACTSPREVKGDFLPEVVGQMSVVLTDRVMTVPQGLRETEQLIGYYGCVRAPQDLTRQKLDTAVMTGPCKGRGESLPANELQVMVCEEKTVGISS